jgi:DNA-binding beta-propeller fold protein YncE
MSVTGLTLIVAAALPAGAQEPQPTGVPILPFTATADFLKYPPDMNLGEVLGVAVNSKGTLVVLNHPGSATTGPLYGNATTQILEFDRTGRFVREIGRGVYGLGYAHSVRFDRHDNLWVVDKGTNSVMKFNPAGYVVMNLGRRPEGYEEHQRWDFSKGAPPHRDGYFDGPTDIGWDQADNIYISDGYVNSRVAKFDKHGNWIKSWGMRGTEPGQLRLPHSLQVDHQGNVYVADRSNRRIQVFDSDGNLLRIILLKVPYDKTRHPVLGDLPPSRPDETAPWTLCISDGPTQHLYASDEEPGRIYKLTLDGAVLGTFGESGRQVGQFNWIHGIACRSDDTLFVADMNNWRVQKLTLPPGAKAAAGGR